MGKHVAKRGLAAYAWQLYALLYKNAMLARRNWISTAVHLLAPMAFVLIFAAVVAASNAENVDRNPEALMRLGAEDKLPRCVVFDRFGGRFGQGRVMPNYPCVTIAYAPDSAEVTAVMARMAALNDLDLATDFRAFPDEASMLALFTDPAQQTAVLAALKFPDDGSLLQTVAVSLSNAEPSAGGPTSDVVPYEVWYNRSIVESSLLANAGKDAVLLETGTVGTYVLQVQRAVNEALLAVHTGDAATKLDVNIRQLAFLSAATSLSADSAQQNGGNFFTIESFGTLFYMMGVMLSFIITLRQIVSEKDQKIIDALRQMGLYESCYWLSWLVTYAVLMLCSSLLMVVAGVATGIPVFVRTSFLWMWIALYLYLLTMAALAMALSAVLPNARTAVMAGFFLLVLGLLFQMFVSLRVFPIVALMYNPWQLSRTGLGAVNLYPPLLYAKMDDDMAGYTRSRAKELPSGLSETIAREYGFTEVDAGSYRWANPYLVPDPAADMRAACGDPTNAGFASCYAHSVEDCVDSTFSFTYDPVLEETDYSTSACRLVPCTPAFAQQATQSECEAAGARFFEYESNNVTRTKCVCQFSLPSDAESAWALVGAIALYCVLAWYLGQVVTFGHGRAEPLWFPLLPSYWLPRLKSARGGRGGAGGRAGGARPRPRAGAEDEDVAAERAAVDGGERDDAEEYPVVMRGLVKDYGGGAAAGVCGGGAAFRAVDGLTLALRRGELLALLGKNGCGKSTLINMLTGMISVSGGACAINGLDVGSSMAEIRHSISVCPQFDILYPELTAREHVRFYGHFKGLGRREVAAQAEPLLATVHLNKLNRPAGQFSGGMRRRLSVVIAAVGAADVLLLDEPSTGLDPQNARHVWDVIQQIKRDRVVILTSHELEEADALGDRIAIMSDGRLVALGSALHLKRRFGGAYRVSFAPADDSDEERAALVADVRKQLPAAQPASGSGAAKSGPMTFAVPEAALDGIPALFRWVDGQVAAGRVKDVGLLQTSLDDVFLGLDAAERAAAHEAQLVAAGLSSRALLDARAAEAERAQQEQQQLEEQQKAGGAGESVSLSFSAAEVAGGPVRYAPTFRKQVRALFRKSLVLQLRQRKTVCCQVFIPLLMIAVMAIVQFLLEDAVRSSGGGANTGPGVGGYEADFRECILCVNARAVETVDFAGSGPGGAQVAAFFGVPGNVSASLESDANTIANAFAVFGGDYTYYGAFEAQFAADAGTWLAPGFELYDLCLHPPSPSDDSCLDFESARAAGSFVLEPAAWVSSFVTQEMEDVGGFSNARETLGSGARFIVGGASAAVRAALGERCLDGGSLGARAQTGDNRLQGSCATNTPYVSGGNGDAVTPKPPQGADGSLGDTVLFDACAFGDDAEALTTEGLAAAFAAAAGSGFMSNWPMRIEQFTAGGEPSVNVTSFFAPALCRVDAAAYPALAALPAAALAADDDAVRINELLLQGQEAVRAALGVGAQRFARSEAGLAAARAALHGNFPGAAVVFRALDAARARAEVDLMGYLRSSGDSDKCSYGRQVYPNAFVQLAAASGGGSTYECDAQDMLFPAGSASGISKQAGFEAVKLVDPMNFVLNGLTSALLRAAAASGASPLAGAVLPQVTTGVRAMPYASDAEETADIEQIIAELNKVMALIMVPLATSFLLPVLVFHIVHEREEKLRASMLMMGLRMRAYWTVQYLFDLTLTGSALLLVYVVCAALGLRILAAHEFGVVLLLFLLWAHVMIALACFLSSFFSRTRNANIALYLLVFASVIASQIVNLIVFEARPFEHAPVWWIMWPQFAYYRCLFLMATRSYYWEDMAAGDELTGLMGVLALQAVALTLAFLYLDNVVPQEFGANRGACFCVQDLARALCGRRGRGGRLGLPRNRVGALGKGGAGADDAEADDAEAEDLDAESGETGEEDVDVAEERRLLRGNAVELLDAPVRVLGLRKRFGSLMAVDGLWFHVGDAMCLTILGPNGSGKSTLFGMLTGLFAPTGGTAVVNGFDIRREMARVHENIGVCPQHDITWASLTVAEHLLLYARLKGVPSAREQDVVQAALASVELGPQAGRQAGRLSGGQRRRLSIAISFIGDPAVVYCDEPTTGIDPGTRQAIEALILAEKKKRTIVCTTHSMPEATKLSDRLCIMIHGKLRTIGTSNSLTTKFSQGFKLQTVVTDRAAAVAFVLRRFPGAAVETEVNAKIVFRFDAAAAVSVADVFEVMRADSRAAGVADFGVRMTSLEEVFVRLAEESEALHGTA